MQLSEIRDSARSKADEQETGFVDNTELNRFVNQGVNYVRGKIAQRFEDYFIIPGTTGNGGAFSTVVGQMSYSLPTTLMKAVRVEQRPANSTSDNDWRRMDRLNMNSDRYDEYYPIREGYVPTFGYFIAGSQLHIKPVPASAYSVRIWFVPRGTILSADSDIPDVPIEYHEMIAEYAAMQILRKSGEPAYKETVEVFNIELQNMLETVEIRDQQAEQMVITDNSDLFNWGL
jgi:hypothetical protein